MFNLSGQIVTLNQDGKQVGGLYDWEAYLVLNFTTKDGFKEYKPVKRIEARSYWLIEPISENTFDAEFYSVISNELVLTDAGKVYIELPDVRTLDRRLYAPISARWVRGIEY